MHMNVHYLVWLDKKETGKNYFDLWGRWRSKIQQHACVACINNTHKSNCTNSSIPAEHNPVFAGLFAAALGFSQYATRMQAAHAVSKLDT